MSVLALVSAVAGFVKVRYLTDKEVIDNVIFRAHYRITTTIFFAGCIFVTANNLIGNPISCLTDKDSIPENVINTYCWVTHTFTWNEKDPKHIFHGVGPDSDSSATYHAYYQWVPFMLFFHGLSFYFPHWIWKNYEGGKIKMISEGIRGTAITDTEERKKKKSHVANFLIETLHMHNQYAYVYFICEFLNFINIIVTMYLINAFLNDTFWTYGTNVINFALTDAEDRTDPMIQVFPRMTKCIFRKYGSSGTIQTHDALCVLALNILNEKIYIFLWFWLLLLAIVTALAVVYSAALVALPFFRQIIITERFKFGSRKNVNRLIRKMEIGDFLLLHLLGQNLNSMTFHDLLYDLNDKLIPNNISKSYPENTNKSLPDNMNESHPDNISNHLYPDNLNNMATMELDRFHPSDRLLPDHKVNVKTAKEV